jgi:alpha-L-rhamnosidase
MAKLLILYAFLLAGVTVNSQGLPAPTQLRCNLLLNTQKASSNGFTVNEKLTDAVKRNDQFQFATINTPQPVFNWVLNPVFKQTTACRILVASSETMLAANKADFWDSKKVSAKINQIIYAGKPLQNKQVYYWKVQVWNEKDLPSNFSAVQSFFQNKPDTIGDISHSPLTIDIQKPKLIVKKENGDYFLDFGKDAFCQLQLHINSKKNDSIWIEVAEALDGPNNLFLSNGNIRYKKITLFVEKGLHDYSINWPADVKRNSRTPVQMPGYIGEVFPFRYVNIHNFSGLINSSSVTRKMVYYPFNDNASSFVSSDTLLNNIWELSKYSIKATSFTGYYLDGDRERVPYEGDALINQLSHYSVDAEYSMARRSMAYLIYHPTWPTEWSLQNIPLAWNDYLYTGDASFLKTYYKELQSKILMPLAGENGLISTKTNKQTNEFLKSIYITKSFDGKADLKDIVDWPKEVAYIGAEKEHPGESDGYVFTTYNAVVNAFYFQNLKLMHKIALVLNKTADAKLYEGKADQVYQSFQRVFVDKTTHLIKDGDSTLHTSLHANMFALGFGLVPKEHIQTVTNFIATRRMACSVYGAQFLLDALYDAGASDYALSLLIAKTERSWYNMLRVGSTITMEAWDIKYKPNLDWNHAWGAAPANIIVRKLMGVEPISPGGDQIQIKPQLGSLGFATLKTTLLKGVVEVSYQKNKLNDQIAISIPGATTGKICLAYNPLKPKIWMDGLALNIQPVDGYFIVTQVPSGKHVFVMQ